MFTPCRSDNEWRRNGMRHSMLWRDRRVKGRAGRRNRRKFRKNSIHRAAAATEPEKATGKHCRSGLHDHGGGGQAACIPDKTLAGDINEEVMAAKEIRSKDGLLDICQKESMHNTEAWQSQRDCLLAKSLDRGPIGRQQAGPRWCPLLGVGCRKHRHVRATIHQESPPETPAKN